jgi:hypothetical protein
VNPGNRNLHICDCDVGTAVQLRTPDCLFVNRRCLGLFDHFCWDNCRHPNPRNPRLHDASWGELTSVILRWSQCLLCCGSSGAGSATDHVTMQNALLANSAGCGPPSPYQRSPTYPWPSRTVSGSIGTPCVDLGSIYNFNMMKVRDEGRSA